MLLVEHQVKCKNCTSTSFKVLFCRSKFISLSFEKRRIRQSVHLSCITTTCASTSFLCTLSGDICLFAFDFTVPSVAPRSKLARFYNLRLVFTFSIYPPPLTYNPSPTPEIPAAGVREEIYFLFSFVKTMLPAGMNVFNK